MFKYLHNGTNHTNTSKTYMRKLGLDDDAIEGVLTQKAYDESEQLTLDNRSAAYRRESDPLFIEASFDNDEVKFELWRDKVKEIKARYSK